MKNKQFYLDVAIEAANSAAKKVVAKARKENRAIPVWKDDHIEYEIPNYPPEIDSKK